MADKVETHVSLHYVLPREERDLWNEQDAETKESWTPMTGRQDEVGEPTEYVALLPEDEIPRFNAARNCKYAVPATTAYVHGNPQDARAMAPMPVPGRDTLRYHFAEEAEDYPDGGEGVVYFHLDTGASQVAINALGDRLAGFKNFTGSINNVDDINGHGSMTLSLLVPKKAKVYVFKVLGDDGSGSSAGIVAAIREATNIASRDPSKKYILSGSLGGPPGMRFRPYEDACALAESFGVICRWSAGNDGAAQISAPANWREDRASIAYQRPLDRIAEFSNRDTTAGSATHGEDILVHDKAGRVAAVDGTSFSLPLWCRMTGIVASMVPAASVFQVNDAELAAGRDTPGSVQEEPHGVLDVGHTRQKLVPPAPGGDSIPPPVDPEEGLPTMGITQFEHLSVRELKRVHALVMHRRSGRLFVARGVEVDDES